MINPTTLLIPNSITYQQGGVVLLALLATFTAIRYYAPNRVLALVVRLWLLATAIAAWKGFLSDASAMPPHFMILALLQLAAVVYYIFFSSKGSELLRIPQWILVSIQGFRILVELILAELAAAGIFPIELTYHGINPDIVSGVLGLALGFWLFLRRREPLTPLHRKCIAGYNVLGLLLLLNIVFHAAGSLPSPVQWLHYPIDNWVMTLFPMQWLPFFLVPLALALHLLSLRKLWLESRDRAR